VIYQKQIKTRSWHNQLQDKDNKKNLEKEGLFMGEEEEQKEAAGKKVEVEDEMEEELLDYGDTQEKRQD
jgi:hypothetical protein